MSKNVHRFKEGDLRRPWSPQPITHRTVTRKGKADELVAIAWAHFAKATTKRSPAAQLALEVMSMAERLASSHASSVETLLRVGSEGKRLRAAVKDLP